MYKQVMSIANVYQVRKVDKSLPAVKHGFIKTMFHVFFLLLAIVIMAVYYSQIEETKRETYEVDKTKEDWVPYDKYVQLFDDYKYDSVFTCDCSKSQISWARILKSVDVYDDYVCTATLTGYNPCYFDPICRDGPVGQIIYYYFQDLCTRAQYLYPLTRADPYASLTSGTVLSNDEVFALSEEVALAWQNDIARSFAAAYEMVYPLQSNDTKFFHDWALGTTFEEMANETYWEQVWGLSYNASRWMAEAWFEIDPNPIYSVVADAIDAAFIVGITLDYRYTNNGSSQIEAAYYQSCAPYQCTWFIAYKKTFLEVMIIVFGLLGGIHAALFVVINIIGAIYKKVRGIEFAHERNDEEDKLEMGINQTGIIKNTDDNEA